LNILAIDTSTEACSAAIWIDGACRSQYALTPQGHSERILPMCDELLAEAGMSLEQMDCLAFGRGPGSFTGIRVGTAVIQGIAFAVDRPVVAVSSLRALAQNAFSQWGHKNIAAAIDARMNEVYWGLYQLDEYSIMQLVGEERLSPPEQVTLPQTQIFGAGSAWASYTQTLQTSLGSKLDAFNAECYPTASSIALIAEKEFSLGHAQSVEAIQPVYLRDRVAQAKV